MYENIIIYNTSYANAMIVDSLATTNTNLILILILILIGAALL